MVAIASSAFVAYDTGTPTAVQSAAADARVHAAPPLAAAAPSADPSTSSAPPTTTTTAPPAPQPDLGAGLASAEQVAGDSVDLGVAVLDLRTGDLVGSGGDKQFYSASLSKLLLVVDMLDRRAEGDLELSDDDLDLVDRALSYSDDGAMDVMWTRFDGMAAIDRVAARLGLTGTHAPDDPSQWGEVVVTADDMVHLYQYVLLKMPEADRDLVVDALSGAQEEAADGFDQFFGLLDQNARGSRAAYAKQGWMYYLPSDVYLHSAGVVDNRYAVAVLTVQSGVSTDTAKDKVAQIVGATLTPLPNT
ncbi:serine hydrolase [Umezawaea tangerina]|uniref:Beta-lactamase class A n=1 Tax=Umezawaea tangerina TaxID=84725 RepID=A0A2T0SRT5_9PSEU|nr:serine hydrolase [Umezawaea tangerina]PRY36119.1 beta-lactamase class A [Umezawaea tangerina]